MLFRSINNSILKEASHTADKTLNVDINNSILKEFEYDKQYYFTSSWISENSIKGFVELGNLWGTSSNDVHFPNYQYSGSGNPTTDIFSNVNHHEDRYVFEMIGDSEITSGSYEAKQRDSFTIDLTNHRTFHNRKLTDKGKGYTYNSFISVGGNRKGPQDGRPVGKTKYYTTQSNGELIYPSNHWRHFSDDNMVKNFRDGYYLTEQKRHSKHWEDYTSSAFYIADIKQDGFFRIETKDSLDKMKAKIKYRK